MPNAICNNKLAIIIGFTVSLACAALLKSVLYSIWGSLPTQGIPMHFISLIIVGIMVNLASYVISGSSVTTAVVAACLLLFEFDFNVALIFSSLTIVLSAIAWGLSAYIAILIARRFFSKNNGKLSKVMALAITSDASEVNDLLNEGKNIERSKQGESSSDQKAYSRIHDDLPDLEVMPREILSISSSDDSYVEHTIRQYREIENIAGYAVSVPRYSMSSTVHEDFNQDIWTQEPDGTEKCRHFNNCYIEARAGHKIDLIRLKNGPIEFLYNRNTEVIHSLHRYIVTPETYALSIGNMPQVLIAVFIGVIVPYLNVIVAALATFDTFKRRRGYVARKYLGLALPAYCVFLWIFSLLVTTKFSENGLSSISLDGIIQYAMIWGSLSVGLYLIAMKHTKAKIEEYLKNMVDKVRTVI